MSALYLDASALVKRYVAEEGSEELVAAMAASERWAMCRVGFVETARAVGLAAGAKALGNFEEDWPAIDVVEVDAPLSEAAAELALAAELRSLDALHLAAALVVPGEVRVATWDGRLHAAASERGLATVPESL